MAESEGFPYMWEKVGLGGANRKIEFPDAATCRENADQLMADGHGHHFAVVGEGCTLILSEMAVNCLLGISLQSTLDAPLAPPDGGA